MKNLILSLGTVIHKNELQLIKGGVQQLAGNGTDICDTIIKCKLTAIRDENYFLIEKCDEVLDPKGLC